MTKCLIVSIVRGKEMYIQLFQLSVLFATIILKEKRRAANVLEKDGQNGPFLRYAHHVVELERDNH